jgi:trehalose 6-phosphate phosphatase
MYSAPEIERNWSLFLDLDGTLIDIVRSPNEIYMPEGLLDTLIRLRNALEGALAIVSGRPLHEIDRLLGPHKFSAGAEHGAVIRYPTGEVDRAKALKPPESWMEIIRERIREWPGASVEQKDYSIAIHYRLAPDAEDMVRDLARSVVGDDNKADLSVTTGKKVFEIRPKGVTKGRAVKLLTDAEPFRGRMPVFVGDDVTDEDGMRMARELGGIGLHVADAFGGEPALVRAWLKRAADLFE